MRPDYSRMVPDYSRVGVGWGDRVEMGACWRPRLPN